MENSTCSLHFVIARFRCKLHGNALVSQAKAIYVVIIRSGHFVENSFRTFGMYITVVNRGESIKPFRCTRYVANLTTSHVSISINNGVTDLVPLLLQYTFTHYAC
jgi:hypothetical protein